MPVCYNVQYIEVRFLLSSSCYFSGQALANAGGVAFQKEVTNLRSNHGSMPTAGGKHKKD